MAVIHRPQTAVDKHSPFYKEWQLFTEEKCAAADDEEESEMVGFVQVAGGGGGSVAPGHRPEWDESRVFADGLRWFIHKVIQLTRQVNVC